MFVCEMASKSKFERIDILMQLWQIILKYILLQWEVQLNQNIENETQTLDKWEW